MCIRDSIKALGQNCDIGSLPDIGKLHDRQQLVPIQIFFVPLRCLPREVERNLWSQAEFDSVTAKKLCELRERFWPDTALKLLSGAPAIHLSAIPPTVA